MTEEVQNTELSAEETAFFESGGETELPAEQTEEQTTAEQAAQEQATEEDPKGERDDKGRFVPHGALHAEREEHKKTKAALEEISRKQAILEDRWNTLLKVNQPEEKTEDDPMPDPDTDIFAFAKWQARQLEKVNGKLSEREQQEQKSRQQSEQEQQIASEWNRSVQEFSAQTPDFKDAAGYLAGLRVQQLQALGLDQASINATIDNEVKGVVMQARQFGKNPAELIYAYAKASGYAGKKTDPNKDGAAEKLKALEAAQNGSKTIAATGGKAGADPLTPEAIADMPAAEFEAWISKPENQRRFNSMMGG